MEALAVIGPIFSAVSSIQAGKQEQAGFQQQAEGMKAQQYQEKLKAEDEGNLRRERLLKALAAQNAYSGAGGVSGGSVEALKLKSISEYEKEQQGADVMQELGKSGYDRQIAGTLSQGKSAKRAGYTAAGKSLLSAGTSFASIGGGGSGSAYSKNLKTNKKYGWNSGVG